MDFAGFIKKLTRWTRSKERELHKASVKHDITRLERERAKEHSALLKQRRFYEKLIRRPQRLAPLPVEKKEIEQKEAVVEKKEIEKIPEPKTIETITPPVVISEKKEVKKIIESSSTIPSSGDIKAAPAKKVSFFKRFFSKLSHSFLAGKLARERKEEEAILHKNEVEERFWQPYNGVKANLIKDQSVQFFNWRQRMLTLTLSLVLCSLAIGLVYVGLLVWQKERLNDNQATLANFDAINTEISKNENEIQEIVAFNHKLDLVNFILTNHVYWSNYLAFLEANTLKDVYFQTFSGDLSGTYAVPAVARNLEAISQQLEVIKAYKLIRSVQYAASQSGTGTDGQPIVNFTLEMTLDPQIFIK